MNNIADWAKIALMGFVGVWIINHALNAAGMSQYKA